jgi:hypothetical protein
VIEGHGGTFAGEAGQRTGRDGHATVQKERVALGVKKTYLTLRIAKGEVQLNAPLKQADLVEPGQCRGPER